MGVEQILGIIFLLLSGVVLIVMVKDAITNKVVFWEALGICFWPYMVGLGVALYWGKNWLWGIIYFLAAAIAAYLIEEKIFNFHDELWENAPKRKNNKK